MTTKYDVNTPFTAEPSDAARRRYERQALALEQNAEVALCLYQGTMSKLRQASGVTPEGRRARRQWLAFAYQYLIVVSPPPAEYPEDVETFADLHCDTDTDDTAPAECDLSDWQWFWSQPKLVIAAAGCLALGIILGYAIVQWLSA